jgi:hypothetical protein
MALERKEEKGRNVLLREDIIINNCETIIDSR